MQYENHDEYIDNPLNVEQINNIYEELEKIEKQVSDSNKSKAAYWGVGAGYGLLVSVGYFFMGYDFIFLLGHLFVMLFCLFKLATINGYHTEQSIFTNISESCKVKIKNPKGKLYDYICRSAGYQVASVKHLMEDNDKIDKYHYSEDLERLKKNVGDREIMKFEYSIISDKYKSIEYKDSNGY